MKASKVFRQINECWREMQMIERWVTNQLKQLERRAVGEGIQPQQLLASHQRQRSGAVAITNRSSDTTKQNRVRTVSIETYPAELPCAKSLPYRRVEYNCPQRNHAIRCLAVIESTTKRCYRFFYIVWIVCWRYAAYKFIFILFSFGLWVWTHAYLTALPPLDPTQTEPASATKSSAAREPLRCNSQAFTSQPRRNNTI